MSKIPQDYDFGGVLDSQRNRQKRLVQPVQDEDLMAQNIKLGSQSSQKMSSQKVKQPKQPQTQPVNSSVYDLNKAAHPVICIFTLGFKVVALIIYLIIGNFLSNILTFIFVIILSSIDFWFVKNISGRLLVGLRWRSDYDQKGKQVWKFQSYDYQYKSNNVDKMFFWASQIAFFVIWGLLLFINLITLSILWSLLLFIACGLCGTNLYGYYQCKGQHRNKVKGLKKQYGAKVFQSLAQRYL